MVLFQGACIFVVTAPMALPGPACLFTQQLPLLPLGRSTLPPDTSTFPTHCCAVNTFPVPVLIFAMSTPLLVCHQKYHSSQSSYLHPMLPCPASLTQPAGADPQPYLAGNSFATETGWLSSFLDIWLFFPRAPLMQLIPALTGVQQLLYAHAGKEVRGRPVGG